VIVIIGIAGFAIALVCQQYYRQAVTELKTKDGVVASFGDLHLTRTELLDGLGSAATHYPLAGLTARVEDSGTLNRRITATRLALLGPFALAAKKRQDDREVYLTIEGGDVAILRTVQLKDKPTAGTEARQFAAKVNSRSRQLAD
jgi:hypothetical protein